jgi:hypothetical protein
VAPHLGGSSSCFRRRKLCPWRDANFVPGAGSQGTSGGGLELRPSSSGSILPLLPPSPRTLRWRPPSLPVSAASLLPSASAMRRSSSSQRRSGGRRAWRGRRFLPGAVRRRPPPTKVTATAWRRRWRGATSTTPSTSARWLGRRQQTHGGAGEG